MAMSVSREYSYLPASARRMVEDIIREEQLTDYVISVSEGSAKGENYLGEITRLKIQGSEKCLNLILKVPPIVPKLRDRIPVNMVYKREYLIYSEILPVLCRLQEDRRIPLDERFIPARLYAGTAEDKEEVLVLTDLAAEGFIMFDRLKCFDLDHLQLVMTTLARFHATSMVLRETDPRVFSELAAIVSHGIDMPILYNMISASFDKFRKYVESSEVKDILERFGKEIKKTLDDCVDPELTAPYNVLCHGDCWSSNFLFKYQKDRVVDMRMIDWQISRLASPVIDLAYLLFTSTDQSTRKAHFSDLLDLYYRTLALQVSRMGHDVDKLYPRPVFRKHLREVLPYGLIQSFLAIPFTLSARGESPDMEKAISGAEQGEDMDVDYTPHIVTRLAGIVSDFVDHKFLS